MAKRRERPVTFIPGALTVATFYLTCRSKLCGSDLLSKRINQVLHGGIGVA